MFFNLVLRNSRRTKYENRLFYNSLIATIIIFYILLSMGKQDVILFLKTIESEAIESIMSLMPALYIFTLIVLFFVVFFAVKFQLERRKHEFGVYLMLGMSRMKLFFLIIAEDVRVNLFILGIGLPLAVFLSEVTSLVAARIAGIGVIGHEFSLSFSAILWTIIGFTLIKLAATLVMSGKICSRNIDTLLTDHTEQTPKKSPFLHAIYLILGVGMLSLAYYWGVSQICWTGIDKLFGTLILGLVGTILIFKGLRFIIGFLINHTKKGRLGIFNIRQIEENIIKQSTTMAISSILIVAAMCFAASGISITLFGNEDHIHFVDYTFVSLHQSSDGTKEPKSFFDQVSTELQTHNLQREFKKIIPTAILRLNADVDVSSLTTMLRDQKPKNLGTKERIIQESLEDSTYYLTKNTYCIRLSDYNELLKFHGEKALSLQDNQIGMYLDYSLNSQNIEEKVNLLNTMIEKNPKIKLGNKDYTVAGKVQILPFTADNALNLYSMLILPDSLIDHIGIKSERTYINAFLSDENLKTGLVPSSLRINQALDQTKLGYTNYLSSYGRRLLYVVGSMYTTLYLALIFLIIANTVMGVQFLMNQRKTNRRYQTLVKLGVSYEDLKASALKQIHWYFGLTLAMSIISSYFGVVTVTKFFIPMIQFEHVMDFMRYALLMILFIAVVEYVYVQAVKKYSNQYILSLMEIGRTE